MGGVIADGRSIGWPDANQFLPPGVRARCLFLSGLPTEDIGRDVAVRRDTLRKRMLDVCDQVVLMVESSELTQWVKRDQQIELERISRIITDDAIDSATIIRIAGAGIPMTICSAVGRRHVENTPVKRWKVGFANQDERLPFASAVRAGMVTAAEAAGVELLLADNRSDGNTAIANVDAFIAAQVDLAVIFNTDARANNMIVEALRQVNIPVIAIDIPIPGATFFGFDNYRAGLMTGRLLGQYVRRQWHGVVDAIFMLELPISGPVPAARMQGQLDGLREQVAVPDTRVVRLDSRNTSVDSCAATRTAIKKIRRNDRVVILGINDEAVLGALSAFAEDGTLTRCVTAGQGADNDALRELRRPGSRMIGAVASFPERYGERVIELACAILQRRAAPPARYTNHCYVLSDETMRQIDLTALRGSVVSVSEYGTQRR
jgi:ribose transport system substrate-binding protein